MTNDYYEVRKENDKTYPQFSFIPFVLDDLFVNSPFIQILNKLLICWKQPFLSQNVSVPDDGFQISNAFLILHLHFSSIKLLLMCITGYIL